MRPLPARRPVGRIPPLRMCLTARLRRNMIAQSPDRTETHTPPVRLSKVSRKALVTQARQVGLGRRSLS